MNIEKIISDISGERIDKFISERLSMSRNRVQKLIDDGFVTVDGTVAKSSQKIMLNQVVMVEVPEAKPVEIVAEKIDLDILYEDNDVIVINKPKGMVVHPANGNYTGTLVNAIMAHCKDNLSGINGEIRPGIVHRIDKDTSGVLVIAKNDKAHISLAEQLKEHSMTRVYIAIARGVFKEPRGVINAPIGRNPKDRKKMAIVQDGRHAITHYKVIKQLDDCAVLEVRLETGRTHQIRVHMTYIGHPLLGDSVYSSGKNKYGFIGQALHAKTLGFIHPSSGKYIEFSSNLPKEFQELLAK